MSECRNSQECRDIAAEYAHARITRSVNGIETSISSWQACGLKSRTPGSGWEPNLSDNHNGALRRIVDVAHHGCKRRLSHAHHCSQPWSACHDGIAHSALPKGRHYRLRRRACDIASFPSPRATDKASRFGFALGLELPTLRLAGKMGRPGAGSHSNRSRGSRLGACARSRRVGQARRSRGSMPCSTRLAL
jgi:hypothetical protein